MAENPGSNEKGTDFFLLKKNKTSHFGRKKT